MIADGRINDKEWGTSHGAGLLRCAEAEVIEAVHGFVQLSESRRPRR